MRLKFNIICLALTSFISCTHSNSDFAEAVPPLSELDVEDPDPQAFTGPAFCNPTGKHGDELKRCYQHNDNIYKDFADEAKNREPWFNFATESWAQSNELDSKFVLGVSHEDEAVHLLDSKSCVELSGDQVKHFTGKSPAVNGRKPYLVRAIACHADKGSINVFEQGQDIFVRHEANDISQLHERRTAVVVYLPHKPQAVYVDCQSIP